MDDKSKKGSQDRSRINLSEEYEIAFWTKELGVTKEELIEVVRKVGNSTNAVRQELQK